MGTRKREAWLSNAPERGTIAELVGLAVLVGERGRLLTPTRYAREILSKSYLIFW